MMLTAKAFASISASSSPGWLCWMWSMLIPIHLMAMHLMYLMPICLDTFLLIILIHLQPSHLELYWWPQRIKRWRRLVWWKLRCRLGHGKTRQPFL